MALNFDSTINVGVIHHRSIAKASLADFELGLCLGKLEGSEPFRSKFIAQLPQVGAIAHAFVFARGPGRGKQERR